MSLVLFTKEDRFAVFELSCSQVPFNLFKSTFVARIYGVLNYSCFSPRVASVRALAQSDMLYLYSRKIRRSVIKPRARTGNAYKNAVMQRRRERETLANAEMNLSEASFSNVRGTCVYQSAWTLFALTRQINNVTATRNGRLFF